jgi:hypothetical protein
MDGCPRQNPAYRPATGRPRPGGAFPHRHRFLPVRRGYPAGVIFFGSGRLFLLPLVLFFLAPLFFYSPLAALALIAVVAVIGFSAGRRRHEVQAAGFPALPPSDPRAFDDVRRAAEDDILALADEIRSLDLDIEMPGVSPEARAEYMRAVDQYDRAQAALDRARSPGDLGAVSSAVEEGRFAIASTRARLAGKEPPARRPPCFFDPRHGPSVRDVMWAPPGGTPRPVPVCAADAISLEEGNEPHARRVRVGNRDVPYWNAPAYYGPWAGGFFSPFDMVLPGLLLGSAVGAGMYMAGPYDDGADAGDGASGDGADTTGDAFGGW